MNIPKINFMSILSTLECFFNIYIIRYLINNVNLLIFLCLNFLFHTSVLGNTNGYNSVLLLIPQLIIVIF